MRAIPIPDDQIWEGAVRKTIMPPDGDMTSDECRAVDAVIDIPHESGMFAGCPRYSMLLELEPGDLEKLKESGRVWLSIYSGVLVPFALTIEGE